MQNKVSYKTDLLVGVDIGGSHITAALVDRTAGAVLRETQVRRPVDPHAEAYTVLQTWVSAIQETTWSLTGIKYRMGIAMPGPFDYEQGISYIKGFNKYESLYGLNVKKLLAQSLDIPTAAITMMNDAAAFLLGEATLGAAKGYRKPVGLTLGTGLGSARMQGDIGLPCDVNVSPLHDGRAEDYLSIGWFLQQYQMLAGRRAPDVKWIGARVNTDAVAAKVFNEFTTNLAIVLERFIDEENPDCVVLGGGIANAFDLFYPVLRQRLTMSIPIRKSALGEAAAMAGAACGHLGALTINIIPPTH